MTVTNDGYRINNQKGYMFTGMFAKPLQDRLLVKLRSVQNRMDKCNIQYWKFIAPRKN